jgi:hypothetical protein
MSPAEGPAQIRCFFRFAVQSPGLFAAILAVSQCHLSAHANQGLIGDRLVLHYYGFGISTLREALPHATEETNDCLVATIIMLMNVDVSLLNSCLRPVLRIVQLNLAHIESFQVHMKGLRLLVQQCGGPGALRFASIHSPILRACASTSSCTSMH